MKKYIIGGVIATLLVIVTLGIANYYTCFAYYLSHRPTIVFIASGDISARSFPSYVFVPDIFNQTTVSIALNWTKGAESNETRLVLVP